MKVHYEVDEGWVHEIHVLIGELPRREVERAFDEVVAEVMSECGRDRIARRLGEEALALPFLHHICVNACFDKDGHLKEWRCGQGDLVAVRCESCRNVFFALPMETLADIERVNRVTLDAPLAGVVMNGHYSRDGRRSNARCEDCIASSKRRSA